MLYVKLPDQEVTLSALSEVRYLVYHYSDYKGFDPSIPLRIANIYQFFRIDVPMDFLYDKFYDD